MKFSLLICLATSFLFSCRTTAPHTDSTQKHAMHMRNLEKSGSNYIITCIDGSTQTVPISEFDFGTLLPSKICPGVLTTPCPTDRPLTYEGGNTLKQGTAFFYSDGRSELRSNGSYRYANGSVIKSENGVYNYPNGKQLRSQNGALFYSDGKTLRSTNGQYYYPSGKTLKNGANIYYPDGKTFLRSGNGSFFYDGPARRAIRNSAGGKGSNYFYSDGTKVRDGSKLFLPDGSLSQRAIFLEQEIKDDDVTLGQVQFSIEHSTDSYSLVFDNLAPELVLLHDAKTDDFKIRFLFRDEDVPVFLNFDPKNKSRLELLITTGTPQEKILLTSTGTGGRENFVNFPEKEGDFTATCQVITTAQ